MAEVSTTRKSDSPLVWVLASVAAGGVAGLVGLAGSGVPLVLALLLATVLLGALALAVLAQPERGLWLMLLALPLDTVGRLITSPVTVTIFHLTLLLTLAAWAIRWMSDPIDGRPRWSAFDIGIALLLAAALWSLPGSLAPAATAVAIVRLLFMWLFFLMFVTWARTERSLFRVVLLVVVTASVSAVFSMAQYAFPVAGLGYIHTQVDVDGLTFRPAAFFDDPNYLGTLLSVAIVASVGMAIAGRRLRDTALWLVPAALCTVGMALTLSRTAWMGAMVGILALVLAAPKPRRNWLIAALVTLVVSAAILAPGAIVSRLASVADIDGDASVRTRYLMYVSTLDMIADEWVFGTGLSAYEVAYPQYRRMGATFGITKPHQVPLALWAETGVMGVIAQLFLAGGIVWMLRNRRRRGWNVYEAIGVAGLLAMLAQSLFQYYLYFEYLWLFLALIAVATRLPAHTKEVAS